MAREPRAGPVSYTHLDVYKRQLVYAVVLIAVMLATNSPFLSVRLQRVKALVRRGKTNPGKEGEAA